MQHYPTELHFIEQNVFNEALRPESRAARDRVTTLISNMLMEGQEHGVISESRCSHPISYFIRRIVSMIDIVWVQQQLQGHVPIKIS